jgi:predicted HTH transcriptional regulator
MLRGGISDPRNKTLMKMFNIIGIGECAGSGISDIYQVWEDEGWVTPKVEEQYNPDRTILTLSLAKTGGKVVEKWRKKVAKKSGEKSDEKNRHIC